MARYRAAPAGTLRAVPLDALTALYDRRSGGTHVVAPPVPEILEVLAEGPADAGTLLDRLGARFDLPDASVATLAHHLDELAALGLVERV